MEIRQNGQIDPGAWDDYLERATGASPYQLWGWKDVYESVYGLQTFPIAAYSNGDISGVLPLIYVNSPLTGRYLTSPPGGIVFENEEASRMLFEQGIKLAEKFDVQYLVIRDSEKQISSSKVSTVDGQCAFILDLEDFADEEFGSLSRKTRQKVNRAHREELKYQIGIKQMDEFYRVYLQAMRERGTPTQGVDFFKSVLDKFSSRSQLIVIYWKNEIVGGGFVIDFADTLYCAWSALLQDYYSLYTSYMLFWASIEQALRLEKSTINLGRSTVDSGPYHFKLQWTKDTVPLYQQYYLNKTSTPPSVGNNRSDSLFYKAFTTVWQRLPLNVTEVVGPRLRKRVPFG